MSSRTILVAASILAAAIAYAGNQLRGGMIVASPEREGGAFGVFQLTGGQVRYFESAGRAGVVCSAWE
jgi:hypothetical protein